MANRASTEITAGRGIVRQRLPDYMIRSACVPLAKSPLNAKRKIDHRKHLAPAFSAPESARKHDEPRPPAEEFLEEVCQAVLPISRIGARDYFFDLGGQLLPVSRLQTRLQHQLGLTVQLRQLFASPSAADMVEWIKAAKWSRNGQGNTAAGSRVERELK